MPVSHVVDAFFQYARYLMFYLMLIIINDSKCAFSDQRIELDDQFI